MEVRELRPGLWRWTVGEAVSVYAELPDAVVLVDPLVPDNEAERFWSALDRDVERVARPVAVLLTATQCERDAAPLVERYRATREPPAGVLPLVVDRGEEQDVMFYLEPYRTLVASFAGREDERLRLLPVELVVVTRARCSAPDESGST